MQPREYDPYEYSNALANVKRFSNESYFIRHGESEANVGREIVSHPERGKEEAGLTPCGIDQVARSVRDSILFSIPSYRIKVVASPFLRTVWTAEIVSEVLDLKDDPEVIPDLRERWFGDFDGHSPSSEFYKLVWDQDIKDPTHEKYGVESVVGVRERMTKAVLAIDEVEDGASVVVHAGHGDGGTILFSGVEKINPAYHHTAIPYFRNAEIRPMVIPSR